MKRWPCLDFARPLKRALWEPRPKADGIRVHAKSDVPVLDRTSFPFAGQPSVQHCSDRVDFTFVLSDCWAGAVSGSSARSVRFQDGNGKRQNAGASEFCKENTDLTKMLGSVTAICESAGV